MKVAARIVFVLAVACLLFGGVVGWLLGQPQPTQGYTVILEETP